MEKNFGPNSEQLPNAEFSIHDAAKTGVEAEQVKVARSQCHNTKKWLYVDTRLRVQKTDWLQSG